MALARGEREAHGAAEGIVRLFYGASDGRDDVRCTGGGDEIEVLGEHDIARVHVEHGLARCLEEGFGRADLDGVAAGGQVRDGDGEGGAMNLLAVGLGLEAGFGERGRGLGLVVGEVAGDGDRAAAGVAGLIGGE